MLSFRRGSALLGTLLRTPRAPLSSRPPEHQLSAAVSSLGVLEMGRGSRLLPGAQPPTTHHSQVTLGGRERARKKEGRSPQSSASSSLCPTGWGVNCLLPLQKNASILFHPFNPFFYTLRYLLRVPCSPGRIKHGPGWGFQAGGGTGNPLRYTASTGTGLDPTVPTLPWNTHPRAGVLPWAGLGSAPGKARVCQFLQPSSLWDCPTRTGAVETLLGW